MNRRTLQVRLWKLLGLALFVCVFGCLVCFKEAFMYPNIYLLDAGLELMTFLSGAP